MTRGASMTCGAGSSNRAVAAPIARLGVGPGGVFVLALGSHRHRLAAAVLAGFAAMSALALPSFEAVRASHRPSDVTLVDRHGIAIQTVRVDKSVRRLPWVPLAEMSPALLRAIVASEDRRFYAHAGVDWSAVVQSAWDNARDTRTRGA